MLKKNITYVDFNDNTTTDTFYFNLSKPELVEMEMGIEGGLAVSLQRIVDAKDAPKLIKEFKKLILASYGVKSDDGKRFIKSDQLREEFSQTAAYNSLFMELATNDAEAALFINGILPRDMVAQAIPVVVPTDPEFQAIRAAAASSQASLPPTPAV